MIHIMIMILAFSHGYWGAIRESSLLICDNPAHNYHSVADTECEQKIS